MELTIAIATWNRAGLLRQTLASLRALAVPPDVAAAVLVCDNNSSDDTRAVVQGFAADNDRPGVLPVRYLFEPTQGKSHALNRILAHAQGLWLLLLDDDVLVSPGWLAGYLAGMARHPQAALLGGPIAPWVDGNLGGQGRFLLEHYPGLFGLLAVPADTPMSQEVTAFGANMALHRPTCAGWRFDTRRGMFAGQRVSGEDVGLQRALLAKGRQGWLLPEPLVRHHIPVRRVSLATLWNANAGLGRERSLHLDRPRGRLGLPLWAYRRLLGKAARAALRWRPRLNRPYCQALSDLAQYWGYLHGPGRLPTPPRPAPPADAAPAPPPPGPAGPAP